MVVLVNIIVTIEVQCLLRDLFLIDYFMNWNSILVLSSLIINDQIFLQWIKISNTEEWITISDSISKPAAGKILATDDVETRLKMTVEVRTSQLYVNEANIQQVTLTLTVND